MEILKRLVTSLEGKKVLVLGDLMLDEHIWSRVSRISPEAPVPIAEVTAISHVPGGCGNVAANLKTLGGYPILLAVVGHDSSGEKLIKALEKLKIPTDHLIRSAERPTILKSRVIAVSQQMVRVDREDRSTLSSALEKKIIQQLRTLIPKVDGVILSDYRKGVLSPAICQTAISLAKKHRKPVAVDPKGQDYSKYRRATVLTPNLFEAECASNIKISKNADLIKAGKILLERTAADNIIITRGKDGLSVFRKGQPVKHIEAVPREVFDITGAGDTVIAALTLALCAGADLADAAQLANYAASVAVGKIGTQPVYIDELEETLEEQEPAGRKIKGRLELGKIAQALKKSGKKIVFTNGCFDILHLGHVRYLKEAKKLGDILIVGCNSDSSVRKLKGPDRPFVSELERAEILASLECVDYVTIFPELRPDSLIKIIKPAIHVKGGDYTLKDLPEKKLVESLGARIVIIPPIQGRSTSSLIQKILGKNQKGSHLERKN